jgi:hypothetical protein
MSETVMCERRETDVRRIEADVAEVAGSLNAAHGRLVQLAAELIETDLWRGYGIKSVEHWLCWRAGLSPQRARQIVAVARRRAELPVTVDSLSRGELSVEQVTEVARYVPAHNDAEAASFAKVATVTQLRSSLSRYRFTEPETDADDSGHESTPTPDSDEAAIRKGTTSLVHDGDRFGLHVDAPLDDGAVIEQALLEAKDALFQSGQPQVTWMDALMLVCRRSLSTITSTGRRDRYRVYVHLDTEGGWLNQGPALPDALMQKLCCDGVIQPVWETEGSPLSVGRSQRIVPDRTRRIVLDRDRVRIVPGCGSRFHLEVHHFVPWSLGGGTDTCNLGSLCPFHHDAVHRGELTIRGNADDPASLRFIDACGRVMPNVVPPTPPDLRLDDDRPADHDHPAAAQPDDQPAGRPEDDREGRPDDTVVVTYRHPPGERIDRRWIHFTPPSWCGSDSTNHPNAPPA